MNQLKKEAVMAPQNDDAVEQILSEERLRREQEEAAAADAGDESAPAGQVDSPNDAETE